MYQRAKKEIPICNARSVEEMNQNLRYNMEGTLMVIWSVYESWADRQAMMAALSIYSQSVFVPQLREMKDDLDFLFKICQTARYDIKESKHEQNVRPVLTVVRTEPDPE